MTHDQQEALAVSDRIIVMSNARIAQVGTPRELYEEPASLFVADFIGDANLVVGEMFSPQGELARVSLADLELNLRHRNAEPGVVKVAIRPDSLYLSAEQPNGQALRGRIAKAAYLGSHMEYTVASPLGDLFVVDRAVMRPFAVGAEVWMRLGDHGVTVIPSPS